MNLKQEYIDTPIFTRRSGQDHDNLRMGQQYIDPYQGYDRRFYDGSDWRRYR